MSILSIIYTGHLLIDIKLKCDNSVISSLKRWQNYFKKYPDLFTNSVEAFGGTQSSFTGLSVTPRILMSGTVTKPNKMLISY